MSKELLSKKITFAKGAYIFIEGDKDTNYGYILEDGAIELTSSNRIVERYKRTIGKGDIFGMITAFSEHPRLLSAIAIKESVIIKIHKKMFMKLLHSQPAIAKKILASFADLLLMYNKIVMEFISHRHELENEDKLYELGKHHYFSKNYVQALYVAKTYMRYYPEGKYTQKMINVTKLLKDQVSEELEIPTRNGETLVYQDGQLVFCEYEPGDQLYVIKEGHVKIVKYRNEKEILLSVLGPGDIFGELAIISEKPRSASAVSYRRVVLWPISSVSVDELINHYPEILRTIFSAISRRLWFNFIRYESKLYQKAVTRVYAFLENKLLEDKVDFYSTESHTFNFGIEELMRMNATSQEELGTTFHDLLNSEHVSFNFGQTTIHNPKEFTSVVKFYKLRDNIHDNASYE